MKQRLLDAVRCMRGKRILVVGDMVADVYLYGVISRISREAPVLVLEEAEERIVAGGAANVAHNAATLGGRVTALGVLGDDKIGRGLAALLDAKGVQTDGLVFDEARPTVTKTRVIAGGAATVSQQVVRIDREPKEPLAPETEARLVARLEALLPEADGVALSDYGSGALTPRVAQAIFSHCRARGVPTIVDSRYHIASFAGADYVKQNDAEIAATVGFALDTPAQLEKAGRMLLGQMQAQGVLVTRGGDGMVLFEANGAADYIPVTDRSEVFDVSGAGDTCVAAMLLGLAAGVAPADAARVSNFASGVAVRKFGTAAVTAEELAKAIGADSDADSK